MERGDVGREVGGRGFLAKKGSEHSWVGAGCPGTQGHTAFGAGLALWDLLAPPSPHCPSSLLVLVAKSRNTAETPVARGEEGRQVKKKKGFLVEEGFWWALKNE